MEKFQTIWVGLKNPRKKISIHYWHGYKNDRTTFASYYFFHYISELVLVF